MKITAQNGKTELWTYLLSVISSSCFLFLLPPMMIDAPYLFLYLVQSFASSGIDYLVIYEIFSDLLLYFCLDIMRHDVITYDTCWWEHQLPSILFLWVSHVW